MRLLYPHLLLSLFMLTSVGCTDPGFSDINSEPGFSEGEVLSPLVNDSFSLVLEEEELATVSLKSSIVDPQGFKVTLESVVSQSSNCDQPTSINPDELSFTLKYSNPNFCTYRYSVKNHPIAPQKVSAVASNSQGAVSEANIYVLSGKDEKILLQPISETAVLGQSAIEITLDIPDGYSLDTPLVQLGYGAISVDVSSNTVTFEPHEKGVTRLIYTISGEEDEDLKAGEIFISVSDSGNHAPKADADVVLDKDIHGDFYDLNTQYTINVDQFVSDPDPLDTLQLIYVDSWGAVVEPHSDALDNLSFSFLPTIEGNIYVTYVVSDHRGGYAIGSISIKVYNLSQISTWSHIQSGHLLFSAPLTKTEALVNGISFESIHNDVVGLPVATFTHAQAKEYCRTKGRLPKQTEANILAQEVQKLDLDSRWPTDISYWLEDNTVFNLTLNNSDDIQEYGNYVSCINELGLSSLREDSKLEAVANGIDKAELKVSVTFDNAPVAGQFLSAYVNGANGDTQLISDTAETDESGIAIFYLTSTKAESVEVVVQFSEQSASVRSNVKFIGDLSTARLKVSTPRNYVGFADSEGQEIVASLLDANDNPIVGEVVTFETSDTEIRLNPELSQKATDEDGFQSVFFIYNGEHRDKDKSFDVITSYAEQTIPVSLSYETIGLCGGRKNTTKEYGFNACVQVADDYLGYWYTATPSETLMSDLGYEQQPIKENYGDSFNGIHIDKDLKGGFGFATFKMTGQDAMDPLVDATGAQDVRWCDKLADKKFAGVADWRIPRKEDLERLKKTHGSLSANRGWPTDTLYKTISTENELFTGKELFVGVRLNDQKLNQTMDPKSTITYTTCIADKR